MQQVIAKLAEEKGVDVIIDASQTLYFKPTLDLTTDAVAAYNKAYPAKPEAGWLSENGAGCRATPRPIRRW